VEIVAVGGPDTSSRDRRGASNQRLDRHLRNQCCDKAGTP
jgi:hypothetical protein